MTYREKNNGSSIKVEFNEDIQGLEKNLKILSTSWLIFCTLKSDYTYCIGKSCKKINKYNVKTFRLCSLLSSDNISWGNWE